MTDYLTSISVMPGLPVRQGLRHLPILFSFGNIPSLRKSGVRGQSSLPALLLKI